MCRAGLELPDCGVFSRSAADFQHQSRLWQNLRKHLRDRFSVARCRRARKPPGSRDVQIFEPHARHLAVLIAYVATAALAKCKFHSAIKIILLWRLRLL